MQCFAGLFRGSLTLDHATRVGAEKTYLTRAFGMDWQVDIDYRAVEVQAGDIFLPSTDGVHELLPVPQLKKLLAQARDNPDACCEALLDGAYDAGSDDNISCQVLVVDSLDSPAADDTQLQASRQPLLPGLAIGQHIDGMLVEADLHASPRSQLYRVHDTITRRTMALKMPSPQLGDDAVHLSRFALDYWIGHRIDHPNVVKGWPVPRQRQCLHLLQEYLDGETLSAWARKNPRPPVQTVTSFAAQIIKGLRALHRCETLHQDIKPDNLFLRTDGTLKLIDLGAACVAGLEEHTTRDRPGAADYVAPEYALNLPRDARSDQFSLAVTLYELLTGQHPFGATYVRADSPADYQKLTYTSACRHNPHVPVWLDAALKKACSLMADDRYAALGEFLVGLESPNPTLALVSARPWLERDPADFWRAIALLLSLVALLQLGVIIFNRASTLCSARS